MRSAKTIHVISCHVEGEVDDVIFGGVAPPPGETLWEPSRFIARDQTLCDFLLNEPRGGVFRHVNLLVPPKHPDVCAGFIIRSPRIRRRCQAPMRSASRPSCSTAASWRCGSQRRA